MAHSQSKISEKTCKFFRNLYNLPKNCGIFIEAFDETNRNVFKVCNVPAVRAWKRRHAHFSGRVSISKLGHSMLRDALSPRRTWTTSKSSGSSFMKSSKSCFNWGANSTSLDGHGTYTTRQLVCKSPTQTPHLLLTSLLI